jgi:microcystin-dependent protein
MSRTLSHAVLALAGAATLAASLSFSPPARASEPFLGQIEYYAFNFAPRGWTFCDGQVLPISQFQALFSLLGTTFGGDGRTTFALPDMRGRIPVHDGFSTGPGLTRRPLGSKGGAETVVLTAAEIPSHSHSLRGTTGVGNQVLPAGNAIADDAPDETYRDAAPDADMRAGSVAATPSQGHENMPPYLVINCSIALNGIFPSRN